MQALLSYLGRHHWGIVATFIALGGTAYASAQLPPNSVGTGQIRPGAVTLNKIRPGARVTLRHPKGRAGGGLTGNYPNPGVALPPRPTPATYGSQHPGPCCGSGWQDLGAPYPGASFYRDNSGVVHLGGLVRSYATDGPNLSHPNLCGGSIPIVVLPVADRPTEQQVFPVDSDNTSGRVDVSPDGRVTCAVGAGDQYVSLDGITFRAVG